MNSFRFLQARAEELSEQVAEHFEIDSAAVAFRPDLGGGGQLADARASERFGRVRPDDRRPEG